MANEKTRPLKVFLCHASGDKLPVHDLYKRLVAEGVDAWLDREKLLPGQDWGVEIPRAVRESDVVVICLSNKSITKEGYIQKEIKFALDSAEEKPEGTIFLIPARLEDCLVPERLDRWQWVDLFEENGFLRLLRSLKLRADRVGATIEPSGYESEDKETEHRLDQLYTEGLAAFYTEDWDRAYQRFQAILRERPNHKNAAEKLAQAERQRNLAKLYAQATEAYKSEDWQTAIKALEELLGKSGDYKDTVQLLKDAKKQRQLGELYTEAKRLHAAQKWQAVIRVFDQIAGIDAASPDPEGLLTSAQKEAAELKRLADLNDLYRQAVHKMDASQWYEARSLLEQVHKAQTGFLDTERLLRKIEDEIVRIEEGRKRNAQVQMLYEQARNMTRAGQWGKALAQMEEIQKLDNQFVDSDGIMEKSKAELEREEQEAQRRRELAALYAEAVSLLEAKKYQEALEKWNAIQAIDPRYKDGLRVKKTAKRKLDELSQPEVVGRSWSKIIREWIRPEANIPVDREILTERLLLLSFVVVVIIDLLYSAYLNLFHIGQSGAVARLLSYSSLGGLSGTVVAFVLNKTIYNWHLKQSLAVIIGWALSHGLTWIIWEYFAARKLTPAVTLFISLSIATVTVAVIKWARTATSPIMMTVIFVGWALAWKAGNILSTYLESVYNPAYTEAFAGALTVLLGLLFTVGIQVERSWEVLKTAFWGALGFAVGNYIVDTIGPLLLPPTDIGAALAFSLWGLIGGAILEAPSRDTRRILFSAGICGMGLLLGYLIALVIVPAVVVGPSYPDIFLYQVSWGIGLGLGLGMLIRRASAIGVLAILGAGMYVTTSIPAFSEFVVRGALIGLVLGYGYGYMRTAEALENKPPIAKTKLVWIGIISFLVIVLVIIASDPTMYDDFNNPLYNGKFNNALWVGEDIPAGRIVQENGSLTFELNDYPGQIGIYASKNGYKQPTSPIFVESKMMLDPTSRDNAAIYVGFGASGSGATSACTIFAHTGATYTQEVSCSSEVDLPEIPLESYSVNITPGTWHLLRIELYPDTMTFTFFVDGNKIGSYVSQDPDKLKDVSYVPVVFVGSGTDSAPRVNGYVDYVKIGKIEERVYLASLEPVSFVVGYSDLGVGKYPFSEGPLVAGQILQANGVEYPYGLFAHAPSEVKYSLPENAVTFSSSIYLDGYDGCGGSGAIFIVLLDDKEIFKSSLVSYNDTVDPIDVSVSVKDGQMLTLITDSDDDPSCDLTVWGDPYLILR